MPGPSANKPGDVYVNHSFSFSLEIDALTDSVYAMNGKTVEIDNTDAEGRLILAGMLQINTTLTSVPQQHLQCGYTF